MKKIERAKLAVQDFAGIDVSAHELEVAMRRSIDDQLTLATFSNNAAGHKALPIGRNPIQKQQSDWQHKSLA